MTADQHAQINTALIGFVVILLTTIGAILTAAAKKIVALMDARFDAQIKLVTDRQDRQGTKLEGLANGEGDKKIRTAVLAMQGEGQIPQPRPIPASTRATDYKQETPTQAVGETVTA